MSFGDAGVRSGSRCSGNGVVADPWKSVGCRLGADTVSEAVRCRLEVKVKGRSGGNDTARQKIQRRSGCAS
jgi:hypothetical protein